LKTPKPKLYIQAFRKQIVLNSLVLNFTACLLYIQRLVRKQIS
jgi:hypothetical protein